MSLLIVMVRSLEFQMGWHPQSRASFHPCWLAHIVEDENLTDYFVVVTATLR